MLLVKYGTAFFLSYLLIGIGLLALIDTPFNEGFYESLKWCCAPVAAISVAFTYSHMNRIRALSRRSKANVWFYTFLTAAVLSVMSWPYSLLFNAVAAEGTPAKVGGLIERKFQSGSRSRTFVIVTRSEQFGRSIGLRVKKDQYLSAPIGDTYFDCFLVGPLGLFYRWRYAESSSLCIEGSPLQLMPAHNQSRERYDLKVAT